MATASEDGTARFWDAVTGKPLTEPLRHHRGGAGVAFRPDGRQVATGQPQRGPGLGRRTGQATGACCGTTAS